MMQQRNTQEDKSVSFFREMTLPMRVVLICLTACVVLSCADDQCRERLKGYVIPRYTDDVDDTTGLKVVFSGKKAVKCGNYVSFFSTLSMPKVTYDVRNKCDNATVLFIGIPTRFFDPDSIVGYPYLHWLVHNIPVDVLAKGFQGQAGDTRTDFLPPLAPFGDHLYTFLVYCQEKYIDVQNKTVLLQGRASFPVKSYAAEHQLGHAVAVNFLVSTIFNDFALFPSLP